MNEINKAIEILKKNKIIEALEFYNNRISISHVPAIQSIQGIESFKYDNIFGSTSFKYYEKNIQFSYIRHGGEIYQNDGGVFNLGQTDLSIDVSAQGTFDFSITNTTNGCPSNASIGVVEDLDFPQLSALIPDTITCSEPDITLNATVDAQGDPYTFVWSTDVNGSLDNNVFTLNPVVSGASVYTLDVQNTVNVNEPIQVLADFSVNNDTIIFDQGQAQLALYNESIGSIS